MNGESSLADVRQHLLALLAAHGVASELVRLDVLNRSARVVVEALADAYRAGGLDQAVVGR